MDQADWKCISKAMFLVDYLMSEKKHGPNDNRVIFLVKERPLVKVKMKIC